jgi:hypothetical protein
VTLDQDRSAVLVWLESGPTQFRARLTGVVTSPDAEDGGEQTVGMTSSPREVVTFVETWLGAFMAPGARTGEDAS